MAPSLVDTHSYKKNPFIPDFPIIVFHYALSAVVKPDVQLTFLFNVNVLYSQQN